MDHRTKIDTCPLRLKLRGLLIVGRTAQSHEFDVCLPFLANRIDLVGRGPGFMEWVRRKIYAEPMITLYHTQTAGTQVRGTWRLSRRGLADKMWIRMVLPKPTEVIQARFTV